LLKDRRNLDNGTGARVDLMRIKLSPDRRIFWTVANKTLSHPRFHNYEQDRLELNPGKNGLAEILKSLQI